MSRLQVSVVNGLVIIMLIVGVHHVVTGLAVHRTGEVASVGANLKYFTVNISAISLRLAINQILAEWSTLLLLWNVKYCGIGGMVLAGSLWHKG